MAAFARVVFFRAIYAVLIGLLIVVYPQPWQALGVSLELAIWPASGLHSLWQWLAPWQPVVIVLLLVLQWATWHQAKGEKRQYQQSQQARRRAYQQLEAQVYEGKPLFERGMKTVEYKPVVDALYWQQQQLTALQHKQSQLEKNLAHERKAKAQLEQDKRKLSLSLLEIKEIDKQRCEQISHLKFCFADELAALKERLSYYRELRTSTYQHWAKLLPKMIENSQYLYLESQLPNHAMLAKRLKSQLEEELDTLVSYFDICPEQAVTPQWQMPSVMSTSHAGYLQQLGRAQAHQWQFVLLGAELNGLLAQLTQQGFNAELVADEGGLADRIKADKAQSASLCVVVDCDMRLHGPKQIPDDERLAHLSNLDGVLEPDTLLLAVSQHWSWHDVHSFQARVDGLLVYPVGLFDVLRCLPCISMPADEDSVAQLEHLLQTQLPSEQAFTLLASNEVMQQKQILDQEQHLMPQVPQALFDLAAAAEALTKQQGVMENSETLIQLSEQLALPMLALVARELVAQHRQNQDISALCLVLWQCYQESVRAFNARTEF
ncbi:hypothetical protein [Motilimonas eburnea]|uniref:hypothetical protein n=1 Tax=Motilimonas eburnea TaxID=1737488 RepID=UPI001E405756|nr:hypothetical protein [Motilimonas eburnea]MCE2570907.1 hypothetical protein [Motilimonas eburnea]